MTEDEAFILAIVDSPVDHTPRLVYADWLDERDDPRGLYLRAECEWEKSWQRGEIPTASRELRKLARGMGGVWVARVSRPPLGVCCDHVRFESCLPAPTVAVLDAAESQLGVRFPYQLRALLLNYNGGQPSPPWFVPGWLGTVERDDPENYSAVGPLARIGSGESLDVVQATLSCRRIGMPDYWVFLALVPDASVLMVEVSRGEGRGRVFYWDNAVSQYDGDAVTFQAASLANFLAELTRLPTREEE